MKLRQLTWPVLLAAAITMASCAQKESIDDSVKERVSLEKWMESHAPDATPHAGGLYTKVIESVADGARPAPGNWLDITYTGYALPIAPLKVYPENGDVFVTRDAAVAGRELPLNPYRTHYSTQRVYFGNSASSSSSLTQAMYRTLAMMKQGETWRCFAPSELTYGDYGSSYNYGYQGQNTLLGGVPSYMDIKLVKVIADIDQEEFDVVEEYKDAHYPNYNDAQGNPVYKDMPDIVYEIDSLDGKGILYLATKEYTKVDDKPAITADSTMNIYYIGRFPDGFIFDTNIDTVAQRVWGDNAPRSAISYNPKNGNLVKAFYYAVQFMQYDSWGHMVFTSDYGYGSSGFSPSTSDYGTQIDPRTPLVFDFYIGPSTTRINNYYKSTKVAGVNFYSSPLSQGWTVEQVVAGKRWDYKKVNGIGSLFVPGTSSAGESWLISPAMDMSAYDYLRMEFTEAMALDNGSHNNFEIYASTTAGSTFDSSQWTKVGMASYPTTWVSVGPVIFDSFMPSANFRIAFKYVATQPSTSAWAIKELSIYALEKTNPSTTE